MEPRVQTDPTQSSSFGKSLCSVVTSSSSELMVTWLSLLSPFPTSCSMGVVNKCHVTFTCIDHRALKLDMLVWTLSSNIISTQLSRTRPSVKWIIVEQRFRTQKSRIHRHTTPWNYPKAFDIWLQKQLSISTRTSLTCCCVICIQNDNPASDVWSLNVLPRYGHRFPVSYDAWRND